MKGAYDKAVAGVDGLLHMASPVQFSWEDPKEVIGPAVNGVTGILASVQKYGSGIKRVVLTSSSVAIVSPAGMPDKVYDEVSICPFRARDRFRIEGLTLSRLVHLQRCRCEDRGRAGQKI